MGLGVTVLRGPFLSFEQGFTGLVGQSIESHHEVLRRRLFVSNAESHVPQAKFAPGGVNTQ